jgi:hypothetical protein
VNENTIGLLISEDEYRELPYPSYSLLSDIKKVGGEIAVGGVRNPNINELDGVMVGKLVDNLVTENKMPDNIIVVKKTPTGKVKEVIKALAKYNKYLPNKEDLFHIDNLDVLDKLCGQVRYLKDKDKRILGIKNYHDYYKALVDAPKGAFIISEYLYYGALKVVKLLKEEYPMLVTPEEYGFKIIPQVKLLGEFNKTKIKGMLDFVVVDDANKTIIPYDLKTGSGKSDEFFTNGYLGWNYYIQAALYTELLKEELKSHPIYKDYKVVNFRFMYASRMELTTTVMVVTESMHESAINGFEYKEDYYQGVRELVNEFNHYNNKL